MLTRVAAASVALGAVMSLLHASDALQFAVIATIRGVFRVHVTRWYFEALGFLVLVLLVGTIVRALSVDQAHLPPWRQLWVRRAVALCVLAAAAAALVDVARRGLGLHGALAEPAGAAACVALLAFMTFVAQATLERAFVAIRGRHRRV
jgi:hypothetical protein